MEHKECKGNVDRADIQVIQVRQARQEQRVGEGHEVRTASRVTEEKGVREEGLVREVKEAREENRARWDHRDREAQPAGLAITVTHGLDAQGTTT